MFFSIHRETIISQTFFGMDHEKSYEKEWAGRGGQEKGGRGVNLTELSQRSPFLMVA